MTLTFEEAVQLLVNELQESEESRFRAGDVLLALEGIPLKAMASASGRSVSYLSNLKSVSAAFPPETRAQDQSWSLHRLCARTDDPQVWLERAVSEGFSVRELREALVEAGEIKERDKPAKTCHVCGAELAA